jgi:hypothetical protein
MVEQHLQTHLPAIFIPELIHTKPCASMERSLAFSVTTNSSTAWLLYV